MKRADSVIPVGLNGAHGRMGKVVKEGFRDLEDMKLVFCADLGDDLTELIAGSGARVVVDFTTPEAARDNTLRIIEAGARPVVGTTGLTAADLEAIREKLLERGLGGIVAPNFSLGALLMMQVCETIAKYMPRCEIVEMHHDQKRDSPSGTALLTAARIAGQAAAQAASPENPEGRGRAGGGVPIHSVRLPGLMAHQQVIFGALGETLTLRHDVLSRECFLPGIRMAVREVLTLRGLQVGISL